MASNYRYIGKDTPRKDARDIVTGRAQYLDDVRLPRMLLGKAGRPGVPPRLSLAQYSRNFLRLQVMTVLG